MIAPFAADTFNYQLISIAYGIRAWRYRYPGVAHFNASRRMKPGETKITAGVARDTRNRRRLALIPTPARRWTTPRYL
jgi:hypothetical protein